MGLYPVTGISTNQFSLLATVFYITYLASEIPTGLLMQRLPLAKYLGANGSPIAHKHIVEWLIRSVICWGICVAATAACKNFGSLVAARVLLGIFEAAVAPAFVSRLGLQRHADAREV